ncbi:hypothetical protein [Salinispora tropica]|uniref:hypothetical protein n=1 Tax=Salinispora tropica TaxID=168695 RepID=UPI0003648F8D|nr:hypothetical protein [Salinispora tropica]
MIDEPHLPMRPLWGCDTCRAEWPCQTARARLLTEYRDNRVALRVYLGALMAEAETHLSQIHKEANLYHRFMSWA